MHKEDIVKTGKEKTLNEIKPVANKKKNPLSFLYKFPKLQDHAYEPVTVKLLIPIESSKFVPHKARKLGGLNLR